ncbi:MAG: hypothetical protein WDA42_05345 [Candidatus Bathyarchaeia archaeon]
MASIWKIDNIDVYVSGYESEGDVKLSKHTVLNATNSSVLHYFGSGAEEVSLQAIVFTETNRESLESLRNAGTTVTLTSDQGSEGSYKIQSISFSRMESVCRVTVPGIADDATVYNTRISLVKV